MIALVQVGITKVVVPAPPISKAVLVRMHEIDGNADINPNVLVTTTSAKPCSENVGTFGSDANRLALPIPNAARATCATSRLRKPKARRNDAGITIRIPMKR